MSKNGKKAHLICAMCGDCDMIHFTFIDGTPYIKCGNCGELTELTEWNEFNSHDDKNPPVDENGEYQYR